MEERHEEVEKGGVVGRAPAVEVGLDRPRGEEDEAEDAVVGASCAETASERQREGKGNACKQTESPVLLAKNWGTTHQ